MSPTLIPFVREETEILVVEVNIEELRIRIINGYGPQETDSVDKICNFWVDLETEVVRARNDGCLVLIQMDANAKVGPEVIQNDPNQTSSNGRRLIGLLKRQNLTCLNSHPSCQGLITRYRKTVISEESAVLDYIITCDKLSSYFQKMVIDDKRTLTMTKFCSSRGKRVNKVSDHNILYAEFKLKFKSKFKLNDRNIRREIFDFKNIE